MRDTDNAYQVKADIPGVKKEDISVRIDGNAVQIDAEVKREKETKGNGDAINAARVPPPPSQRLPPDGRLAAPSPMLPAWPAPP